MNSIIKNSISGIIVVTLLLVVIVYIGISELFQSRTTEFDLAQIYANPINIAKIENIKNLTILNKNGEYQMTNLNPEAKISGPWELTSPIYITVKKQIIEKVISALKNIQVRNLYKKEPINETNFSLDNPVFTLELDFLNSAKNIIDMGLINPIDNSAYMSLKDHNMIYQIDPLSILIENFDLSQIAEKNIFNLSSYLPEEIEVQQGFKKYTLKNKDATFYKSEQAVRDKSLKTLIDGLDAITVEAMVDRLSPGQKRFVDEVFKKTENMVRLRYPKHEKVYYISNEVRKFPELNIGLRRFHLVSTPRKDIVLVINQNDFNLFKRAARAF